MPTLEEVVCMIREPHMPHPWYDDQGYVYQCPGRKETLKVDDGKCPHCGGQLPIEFSRWA